MALLCNDVSHWPGASLDSALTYMSTSLCSQQFVACWWPRIIRWQNICRHGDNSLLWRQNGCDGVSNHQPHDCLLNRSFRRRSKKNIKAPRHWPLCGNSPMTGEFPAHRASNAENVSIWWRHHVSPGTIFAWDWHVRGQYIVEKKRQAVAVQVLHHHTCIH